LANIKAAIKLTGSRINFVYILLQGIKFLCMQFFIMPDIGAISLRPLKPR